MRQPANTEAPLLGFPEKEKKGAWSIAVWVVLAFAAITISSLVLRGNLHFSVSLRGGNYSDNTSSNVNNIIESERGVVASDEGRCSDIGALMLRKGGHAVDAAVSTALCLGVVNPVASGIGGGSFMIVRSAATSQARAYNMRERAPLAASENMYENNPSSKSRGALSIGVPGEIVGLYEAWSKHGQLRWRTLFLPAIRLAKDGFVVAPYLALSVARSANLILRDPGLRRVFAPSGKLLREGDTCYNVRLAETLEEIAEKGPQVLYNGTIGEKLVKDVREAGGILEMEDLKTYKVEVTEPMAVNVMGYTMLGMPPPSSGFLGFSLVLNILESYGSLDAVKVPLSLHRLVEALKHMYAVRMNLGDPNYVDIAKYISDMLSPSFAKQVQQKILDNTTFPSNYYMYRWSQLRDHGTSHFCVVDADRNAVSMTTTINYGFGAGVLSPSTGILLNNQMNDFSTPTEISSDRLPPAPSNFVEPGKRPLSSTTPIIIVKNGQLVGVTGGSGGLFIIPAVIQVFLNHFILGMDPLAAVQYPRVYHKLIPNVVVYENWTVFNGDHIELSHEGRFILKERGHQLEAMAGGANCQLVIQTFRNPIETGRKHGPDTNSCVTRGRLIAVSDPRKDGRPAAI